MKIVVVIDSMKGCLSSADANQAAADGVRSVFPDADIVQIPVSDGGEGFVDAFHAAIGGTIQEVAVRDPLMRCVTAQYLLCGQEAVIEIAQASGLTLLSEEERNPMVATSYGTGQLIADAIRKGAKQIIVGLGGSATSDAGMGMLRALIDTFAKQGQFDDITELKDIQFTIASDVKNPLCGAQGAAHIFAPQKGASPEMVERLDARARKFAEVSAKHFGYDCSNDDGAGAAGGLGYAFLQYMHATCRPGIEVLLEAARFREVVKDADLVITGEGSADSQTLMGKLPVGVLHQSGDVPVCLIAGRIRDREALLQAGFSDVRCINPEGISLQEAMRPEVARKHISDTIRDLSFFIS
ncbi:glycerate kinase [Prevotella sp. E9-3]|uniref:glycerate kinase family protein n=1 Tax=Prevotella sp. E9-3 TaxID=2913621 RepID=UPI001EDB36E3|nr:glycerate kinase [Prevotella sp. E9-3]UKK47139.1 glycerate kinase [Prevotella sp. E9-3]